MCVRPNSICNETNFQIPPPQKVKSFKFLLNDLSANSHRSSRNLFTKVSRSNYWCRRKNWAFQIQKCRSQHRSILIYYFVHYWNFSFECFIKIARQSRLGKFSNIIFFAHMFVHVPRYERKNKYKTFAEKKENRWKKYSSWGG